LSDKTAHAKESVALDIQHDGAAGKIELSFGEWNGSLIDIAFRDRLYRNSGVIQLDGQTGRFVITTFKPYSGRLAEGAAFDQYFASILRIFAPMYTFGWSPPPETMVTYDAGYHEANHYIQGDRTEMAIKSVQARIIRELASPRKCVVAGCSNGELVRQSRAVGIDAYGFDIIPNLQEIAFGEVRGFIKYGSLAAIPFDESDGFDTLIAIDVLEHIPERDIPQMVSEWRRLAVTKLVLLINLNQFWYPGHVTLRPLSWWAERFAPHFDLTAASRQFPNLPEVYSNTGDYNQQWTLWSNQSRG
jgi:hypothetical protein